MSQIHTYHQYDPMKNAGKRRAAMLTAIGLALGATGTTATVVGAGVVGLAAYGGYRAMAGPKTVTQNLPGSQALKDAEPEYDRAAELAKQEMDQRRRGIARNKPNYTSAMGLTPVDKSNTNLKTLTGK